MFVPIAIPETISVRSNGECRSENCDKCRAAVRLATSIPNVFNDKYTKFTYYCAQSMSWYSLDRSKHSWTPLSFHKMMVPSKKSYKTQRVVRERLIETTKNKRFSSLGSCRVAMVYMPTRGLQISRNNWGDIYRFLHPILARFSPRKQACIPETCILQKSRPFRREKHKNIRSSLTDG